jgi:type IV pilus assembly protein PilC
VTFTTQFASMIGAHIPLVKTIDNLEGDMTDKDLKPILSTVSDDLKRGVDFSEAIAEHPNAFDTIYVNMVGAGMASGKLDMTLKQLSSYLTKRAETANKVRSALTYPIFMFVIMIAIITMMLIFVIPMFENIFASSSKKEPLPEATQIAIALSEFLQANWWMLLLGLLIIVVVSKIYISTKGGKRRLDLIKIKMPIFGKLNSKSAISKFIRTFGILVKSDIPILKAIELSKSSSANVVIEESISNIVEMIVRGYGVAEAFKEVELFPDIVIQMISSGEESGNIDELLISTANYYDDQVDSEISAIVSLINPVLTIIIAACIVGLLFAIYSPILKMDSAMS